MKQRPFGLAVKALVRDPCGRYLFIRRARSSKHWPGKWDLPGGKVDPGEDLAQALRREVREETGLVLGTPSLVGAVQFELTHTKVACLVFSSAVRSSRLRLSSEHSEACWRTARQFPALLPEVFPPLGPLLRTYRPSQADWAWQGSFRLRKKGRSW